MPQQISIFDFIQYRQNRWGNGFYSLRRVRFSHTYNDIISIENLLEAWEEFIEGKKSRVDVQKFGQDLMGNIIELHRDLAEKIYKHSPYEHFRINDPKPRDIHKACVRDRLLHRALYRKLYLFFDKTFIPDSYSCRLRKGTHKAIDRFRTFARKESKNHTKTVWVLKCDVRKFFASVNQNILKNIIREYIPDKDIVDLIDKIISSFYSVEKDIGLPLGNITSQLLVNIYMNKFDQFVKHIIKAKYYIRYADDFVIFSSNKEWLENIIYRIRNFLWYELKLQLHPNKVSICTVASGADYLGWINYPDYRILRTATKKRMFRRIYEVSGKIEVVQSYLGMISHGNSWKLINQINTICEGNMLG